MKTKGTNSDVAHYWANQTQDQLSNANGSFYFEGKTIYSYGKHFPIASILDDCVLFTTGSYSVTTAKHISDARQAIRGHGLIVFNVDNCEPSWVFNDDDETKNFNHINNFKDYVTRYDDILKKAATARSNKEWLLGSAESLANEANMYADHFKLGVVKIDASEIDLESIKETLKIQRAEKAKAKKAAKIQAEKDNAEKIERWRGGERVNLPYNLDCMIRFNAEKDIIETSQGANIPVIAARKLWRLISAARNSKKAFDVRIVKMRLGHYTLDSIGKNGDIKVGCHFIKYAELQGMAKTLNLLED